MTLTWIESQLEEAISGANSAKNVYDAAALIIVRNAMLASAEEEGDAQKRNAIVLTSHSADLDVIPTLEQAEAALAAVAVNTPEERDRVERARTWASILKDAK